jgi:hypothetical protein
MKALGTRKELKRERKERDPQGVVVEEEMGFG